MARRGAERHVERARAADGFLHEVGERPAAADVGRVGGVVRGDGGRVGDEVVDADVCVRGRGGEGEEDGEEGVLEEDGLPDFAALLLFEGGCVGGYWEDVREGASGGVVGVPMFGSRWRPMA